MSGATKTVVVTPADRPVERFDDRARGDVTWHTFISGDRTPTAHMSAGLAIFAPGGGLAPHRHFEAEIYFVHEGAGVATIDGAEIALVPGMSIFIPGDAEHSVRNTSGQTLKIFYVFPTDRFSDVVYRFSA
jgi:quercetin dioxygenase-like cupin family protein